MEVGGARISLERLIISIRSVCSCYGSCKLHFLRLFVCVCGGWMLDVG